MDYDDGRVISNFINRQSKIKNTVAGDGQQTLFLLY